MRIRAALLLSYTLLGFASPLPASAQVPIPTGPVCLAQPTPPALGPSDKPADVFNLPGDYKWMHSDAHLQGFATFEKWAWGFFQPNAPQLAAFAGFQTAVIVNNPSEITAITFDIEYYDTNGTQLAVTQNVTVGPRCFYTEQATALGPPPVGTGSGVGSIRVVTEPTVMPNGPFVGATIHHSYTLAGITDVDQLPNIPVPGLASMQQLQALQPAATRLFAGPFPVTTLGAGGAPLDPYPFYVGNLPTFQVINPNPTFDVVQVDFSSPALGGTFSSNAVVLPPFGSYIDLFLFTNLIPIYLASPPLPLDLDVVVSVRSLTGSPLIGESLMFNLSDENLQFVRYFRMGSAELASTPALSVVNPELTFETTGPLVRTLMSIANTSASDIGPLTIEYRDQAGVVSIDTIATFPPGATQRIAPGEPGIANYPVPVFDGTVRVFACRPGLVGWTMRTSDFISDFDPWFHKVWGEPLENTMGLEPGNGITVAAALPPVGGTVLRKVASIERIADPSLLLNWWPHYIAIANLSSANIGNYWFRSFQPAGGGACSETTDFGPQPFLGLPFGEAALTFVDRASPTLSRPPVTSDHMGLVDRRQGRVFGINAIGDPLWEWNLGFPPFNP